MITKIRKLLLVSRPVSWLNTAYPFGAGYLMTTGRIDSMFIIGTLFFLFPYNLLMYGVNDIFDYESDIRNPRKGGLEGAKEQKAMHPVIWIAVLATIIPFVAWFVSVNTVQENLALFILLFFVIAYSVKYLRFKEIPILDSITSSSHFVGPLIFALVLTGGVHTALPYIIAFFLWGMASHAFGAIQDIKPDREGKIASVATVLGAKKTARLVFCLYALSCLLVIAQGFPALLVGIAGLVYVWNVYPFVSLTDKKSGEANFGWRRFIWLNYIVGFVLTIVLIVQRIYS